jgi:hypothetical protein
MKSSRNMIWGPALGLSMLGLLFVGLWVFRPHWREITRAELALLIQSHGLSEARLMPTPCAGIYLVEGTRQTAGRPESVFITTHLEAPDVKALSEKSGLKVERPGQGFRGQ